MYPSAIRDTEKDILKQMNLTIHPGEKLAVVGLNGAGKTTMVMLLCGFYDPTEGRVLLNGQDIREFDRRQYYRLFSAVFQGFSILDTTIAECVAQTAKNIDMEKVSRSLARAGLTETVAMIPPRCKYPLWPRCLSRWSAALRRPNPAADAGQSTV